MADYTRCINALNRAAGKTLTDDELADVFNQIKATARDIAAGRIEAGQGMPAPATPEGVMRLAAEIRAKELVSEKARAVANAYRQVRIVAEQKALVSLIGGAKGIGPVDAVRRLIANDADGRANAFSLEARTFGVTKELQRKVQDTWAALGDDFAGFLQDPTKIRNLLTEIKGGDSGDALAKKGAQAWLKTAEDARLWFNEIGGKVGKLEDWGMPQHHSQERVLRAGRDKWVADIMPRIDRSRYVEVDGAPMTDAQVRDFLSKAWETIATNGVSKQEPGAFKGTGARSNSMAEERQIHFKGADDLMAYWQDYGDKTMPDILMGHLGSVAKNIAFVEHFGPNPDATYRMLRDEAMKAQTDAAGKLTDGKARVKAMAKAEKEVAKLDRLYDYASGKTAPVMNKRLAAGFNVLHQLNVAGKLGSAFFASLYGDKVMFEAIGHVNNLPAFQRWYNELRLLNPANAKERQLLRQQGLMLEHMTDAMNRFGDELGSSSLTGKLATGVIRTSGMAAVNEWRRGAWALTAMDTLGGMVKAKDFAKIGAEDMRLLGTYGISETDWKVWKLARLEDVGHGNDSALTPDAVGAISDADLKAEFPELAQSIRDAIESKTLELSRRNAQESGWIKGRIDKFDDARDAMNRWVKDRLASRQKNNEKATGPMLERMALLDAQREQAQMQADMESDFNRFSTQDQMRSFLNAVEDGRSADLADMQSAKPAVRQGLESAEAVGKRYGIAKGRLERRMVEIQNRISEMDRKALSTADADAKVAQKKADEMTVDLNEFIKRSQDRQSARQHVIDRLYRDEGKALEQRVNELRRSATIKLLGALTSESHLAVVEPGWNDRAKMYGGLQRGNIRDELTRSFWQFKAFPFAQFERMLDISLSRPSMGGKIGYLAAFPVMGTIAGAMMLQTQDLLSGKDPRPMDNWKFLAAAALKGGSLGLYGDFLYSQVGTTRFNTGFLEAMAGPVIGGIGDIADFAIRAGNQMSDDPASWEKAAARTVNIAKGYIPGQNLWMTKWATDHLIFQTAQEYLNPGYLSAMEDRTYREFGQEWWLPPGASFDELRAPNWSRALEGNR